WYAQTLGTIFTDQLKPFEVEIVVAEVGATPADDQIYRITFDGSVTDEPGFVAFGGQADQVSAVLKERYADNMSLSEAFAAALAALSAPGNGEYTAAQLEVAILERARDHRTFRRIRSARLEQLLSESRPAPAAEDSGDTSASGSGEGSGADSGSGAAPGSPGPASSSAGSPGSGSPSASPAGPTGPADSDPPTGPAPGGSDRGSGLGGGSPL
ncbi:MAG TPA: proteasome subunit alpha, partial [Streptosporangiaceae bacterium]|nr:proteasome subunit alpha [Streptosporangiaceae bacterium]